MSFPEEPPEAEGPAAAEEPAPEEPTYPETILPEGYTPLVETAHLPRSRRRRAHRMLVPPGATERAAMLDSLARRAIPSFEFFLFAILCGAMLGAGYLLDMKTNSQAILLLGLLLAPLLTPWVGMILAATTGSWRFFFLTLGGMLVASLLVFLTGGLAGWAGRMWFPPSFFQVDIRSHIWWLDLFIVVLGAALMVVSFIRSEQKPILPSILLAYGLFMPASAAGFEWGIGNKILWQSAAGIFLLHLALAAIVGGITFMSLHFKPAKPSGYFLPIVTGVLSVAAVVTFTGFLNFGNLATTLRETITGSRRVAATPTVIVMATRTPTLEPTQTITLTPVPSGTALPTDTPVPTPAYAIITSPSGGGALVRTEPGGGTVVATLINGTIVQVLPDIHNVGNSTWVAVRLQNNVRGYVLMTVLTATDKTPLPLSTSTASPTP